MDASEESFRIDLPEKLDSAAAQGLYDQFNAQKDTNLHLNGEHVSKIGGLCLQVLIAAKEEWSRQNLTLEIHSPSDSLGDFLNAIGRTDLTNVEPACL